MPGKITILHVSDMQFGKFHRFTGSTDGLANRYETLVARLIEDLELLKKDHQLVPDLIVCTGDLAEWGLPSEFRQAFEFLGTLCDHYGLPRSRCIVIPGNHDINRKACEAYFAECAAEEVKPVAPWFPKWKHYKAAFDEFYEGFPGIAFTEAEPWSVFEDERLKVVVAGLNSTMDEGHDAAVNAEDRVHKGHHGRCEERQLQWFKDRLDEEKFADWLRIGAVHHNLVRGYGKDDEYLYDADRLGNILGSHLNVLLHGHTHEAAEGHLSNVRIYSTGSASLATAGENPPVPVGVPNQYQFLVVESTGFIRYCRRYDPSRRHPRFIADTGQSKNGSEWIIRHDEKLPCLDTPVIPTVGSLSSAPELPAKAAIPKPPALYAQPDYIGSHRFVGRRSELETLSDWAKPADPTNLLLFEAIGGNGKSMLTWEWTTNHAGQVRTDWAGRFWFSFYERGAVMADFCRHALAYMTQRPLEEFAKRKTADMAPELLAQLHARPWLLILDGLERVLVAYHRLDAAEVPDEEANQPTDKMGSRNPTDAIRDEDNDLLRALAAAKPSKILVSSRLTPRVLLNPSSQAIQGVRRIDLPGLRPEDAESLLKSCGVEGDSAAIQTYLAENCDNHPLVIGILGGLIRNYLPDRGNFDAWVKARDGGAALDLGKLDLIQRRNHILRASIEALPDESRQLLSTLALISEAVDYETVKALNPHLPPEIETVERPPFPHLSPVWMRLSDDAKDERRRRYETQLSAWNEYENQVKERLASDAYATAPLKLGETVRDLELRGLLQWNRLDRKYDLHPVVRAVAASGMKQDEREQFGMKVVDHFSSVPHDPYEDAETIADLGAALHTVRTLLKLGKVQEALDVYRGELSRALMFNVEAFAESLSIVRFFFSENWSKADERLGADDASYILNNAGITLSNLGLVPEARSAYDAALVHDFSTKDWARASISLFNLAIYHGHRSAEIRILSLAEGLSEACEDADCLYVVRLLLFSLRSRIGEWDAAESTWRLLAASDRDLPRNMYRPGDAEFHWATSQFWQGRLEEEGLASAEKIACGGRNRTKVRYLHSLRGAWRLECGEWNLAAASFGEAVRMAREVGLVHSASETGLALAKFRLGQLLEEDARREAELLGHAREHHELFLARLWQAIEDLEQAKRWALRAYETAWGEGEPYVHRYNLTKSAELLTELGVPIPELPPYDPSTEVPFPWEADIRAAIEELRAKKARAEEEEEEEDF